MHCIIPSYENQWINFLFKVNYLGHFLLVTKLLPVMLNSGEDCRIVLVSSEAYLTSSFDLEKAQGKHHTKENFKRLQYYGNSKLYQVGCWYFFKPFHTYFHSYQSYMLRLWNVSFFDIYKHLKQNISSIMQCIKGDLAVCWCDSFFFHSFPDNADVLLEQASPKDKCNRQQYTSGHCWYWNQQKLQWPWNVESVFPDIETHR